ncbi:collagen-like protein [Wolbachia endosymbiont of Aedes albopictus]|uniref:collagen-like protein n=1 Tax=Wolbachia endosymbiont of Aedes albopictus TaxID=167957 RepID=UPI0021698418|nr:collagen-like protein [Wolbachia endosymbiont of Aedes albopictus]UVW84085.1 collagen-like protein [Wolbachia endosymbiont of Aedes albopictus]
MTTDKDQTIWKWENTAHITKIGIEGTVALASLAGAITAILIATKVIAGPASLALVASPAGIAVLFIAAIYSAAAAYVSYQQMNAIGEKGPQGDKGPVGDKGPQGEKGEALNLKYELQKPEVMKIFEDKFQEKGPALN